MSSGFLLDTNCVSETAHPRANAGVLKWLNQANESQLYISVLTIGEIRKGVEKLAHGKRRAQLEVWLDKNLRSRFYNRTLPISDAIAERWGVLEARSQALGRPVPVIDGLLAATALEHDLTLVTRNTRDFEATFVPVFSPWKP